MEADANDEEEAIGGDLEVDERFMCVLGSGRNIGRCERVEMSGS